MTFRKRLITAIATGALLLNAVTPWALAATTIEISGNGSDSENKVKLEVEQKTTVVQENNANITNDIDANANTGDNKVSGNTGGDASIDTGKADVDVTVTNKVNTNVANVDCCNTGNTQIKISGNGSESDNDVKLEQEKKIEVFQNNDAYIHNDVDANANTGDNKAKDNTGGSVSITTGDASTDVDVTNKANENVAKVSGDGQGGSLSVWITGNGSDSENKVKLDLDGSILVTQDNKADIKNDIDADADSGNNKAEDNTGGDVSIDTGKADVDVDVNNEVNFNWADVNCDCLLGDLTAKISGNGTDSENKIKAELEGELEVFQDNCSGESVNHDSKCGVDNDVDADAGTGDNKVKDNTGDPGGDPTITTDSATTDVDVNNSGNVNVYGKEPPVGLPDLGGVDLSITIDLSALLEFLGLV